MRKSIAKMTTLKLDAPIAVPPLIVPNVCAAKPNTSYFPAFSWFPRNVYIYIYIYIYLPIYLSIYATPAPPPPPLKTHSLACTRQVQFLLRYFRPLDFQTPIIPGFQNSRFKNPSIQEFRSSRFARRYDSRIPEFPKFWTYKALQIWNPGIMGPGKSGILDFWDSGILESWDSGLLEFGNSGILGSDNRACMDSKDWCVHLNVP